MITHPIFNDKYKALETAKETANLTGTSRFVVCHAGRYQVKLQHTQGPLASWFAKVFPDGSVVEGF